jgi:hypothetical protein
MREREDRENTTMEQAKSPGVFKAAAASDQWEKPYRPLPHLSLAFSLVWTLLACIWTINTWTKRRFQRSHLQWVITTVPALKALVLGLTYVFWYSCLNLSTCSFWVAFGVFVSRIFLETTCVISYLLVAHGYCIIQEQLSLTDRRRIAGLTFLVYLTLTGYKSGIEQFCVLVMLMYLVLLCVIMAHISHNLVMLQEHLEHIEAEVGQRWHTGAYAMLVMFKKFRRAVALMVAAKLMMLSQGERFANEYPRQLVVRELVEVSILLYMGWIVRSQEPTPFSTVIPILRSSRQCTLPPIYSVEMEEKDFNNFDIREWHIGVQTSNLKCAGQLPILVIVQNPGVSNSALINNDFYKDHPPARVSENEISVANFQTSKGASVPLSATVQAAAPSIAETDGLQQRVRNMREETSTGGERAHSDSCQQDIGKGNMYMEGQHQDTHSYAADIVVDMKGWKRTFSLLSFNNDCNDLFMQSYCLSSI